MLVKCSRDSFQRRHDDDWAGQPGRPQQVQTSLRELEANDCKLFSCLDMYISILVPVFHN